LSAEPTSKSSLLAYAGPAIPLRILLMQLVVYVPPFYAAEMGLEIATIGLIFFLARGWDALIDPLVGNLSDRTRSRWGRRKPWMAVGTPLLICGRSASRQRGWASVISRSPHSFSMWR
jgi:Na+/melibiose symporter-like transporter